MTRMPVLRFILMAISLMLTGCMSGGYGKNTLDISERVVDNKRNPDIAKLKPSNETPLSAKASFHRQLALTFPESEIKLTEKHEQIIRLFFQTIPRDKELDIVISVAPASGEEQFKSLQSAWKRLRSLEEYVSPYSANIKLIYQPELEEDTAILKVVGGDSV